MPESLLNKVAGLEQPAQNSFFTKQIWTDVYALTDPWEWRKRKCVQFVKKKVINTSNMNTPKPWLGTISFEIQVFATSIIGIQFLLLHASNYVKSGSFNQLWVLQNDINRGSPFQMFFKIGAVKNFTNFIGKQLCWSIFLIKLQAWRLRDTGVFSVKFAKFLRTIFFRNHLCRRLETTG